MERFRVTIKVGQHRSTSAVIRNLIDFLGLIDQAKKFGIESFVYIIVWALGKLRIDVTCIFKVSQNCTSREVTGEILTKIQVKLIENTNEMNP